jgi:Ca2+-binding RTX toxin-like protein
MAKLYGYNSGFGIDNTLAGGGEQFLADGGYNSGIFDGNYFAFQVLGGPVPIGETSNGKGGKGWYEGSGFKSVQPGAFRDPTDGTVSRVNVDFQGGNTADVVIEQLSNSLIDVYTADWAYYENSIFNGADNIWGSLHGDSLEGYAGNDTVIGDYGDDTLFGGAGDDQIYGDDKNATRYRNNSTQPVTEYDPAVYFATYGDDDTLFGGEGDDDLFGGVGNDTLFGGADSDSLVGGDGNDELYGGDAFDHVHGGAGDDTIDGGAGADHAMGNAGDDTFIVDNSSDTVIEASGEGWDKVIASADYTLSANVEALDLVGAVNGTGNELANKMLGSGEANSMFGLAGNDELYGGGGNDSLDGGDDSDFVFGDGGNDHVHGGAGVDFLYGGDGNDHFIGGTGDDTMTGGADADTFVLSFGMGNDTIDDFETGVDIINFSGSSATGATYSENGAGHRVITLTDGSTVTLVGIPLDYAPTGSVAITGSATQGQTVSADTSGIADSDGISGFSYQWLRNGITISGATGADRLLTQEDVGATMSVRVGITDGLSNTVFLTEELGAPVKNLNDAPVGSPSVTGTATQGQTLSADTSAITDADGLGSFSYQWLRDAVTISGGTGIDRLLTKEDVGATMSVRISYTDGGGEVETLTSTASSAVANVNDAPSGEVSVTGSTAVGDTLTADASSVEDIDGLGTLSFQWMRGDTAISGATSSSYELTSEDSGTTVTVKVSYTDGGGTAESLTSAGTEIDASDPFTGDDNDNTIIGNSEANDIFGLGGNDKLVGKGGGDVIDGGIGDDKLFGGGGKDKLSGDNGKDTIKGNGGNDKLFGESGNDKMFGGGGKDEIVGASGDDDLTGNKGNDTLTGGTGFDTFHFKKGDGDDTIRDFNARFDTIDIGRGASNFDNLDVQQAGDDVEISFSNVTILLKNFLEADVTSDLFTF